MPLASVARTVIAALLAVTTPQTVSGQGVGDSASTFAGLPAELSPAAARVMMEAIGRAPAPHSFRIGLYQAIERVDGRDSSLRVLTSMAVGEFLRRGVVFPEMVASVAGADSIWVSVPLRVGEYWTVYRMIAPPREERTTITLEAYFVDPVAGRAVRIRPERVGPRARAWRPIDEVADALERLRDGRQ